MMRPTVVKRLSGSPVGVTEKPRPGPLKVAFRVRGQTHPKVKYGIVNQSGDEGCEGENRLYQSPSAGSNVRVQIARDAHNELHLFHF